MQVAFWKSLGVAPTPMTISEVYTGLQQGTIDGQENPAAMIYSMKFHEVAPHITVTGHVYEAAILAITKKTFDSLSPEYQKAILEAGAEASAAQRAFCVDYEKESFQKIAEEGGKINESVDLSEFRAKAEAIHSEYGKEIGAEELVAAIKNVK